jgi:aspartate racemase
LKTAGIIGGIGPESTIDYYRQMIEEYRRQKPDGSYPAIVINSIDLHKLRGLIECDNLPAVVTYLTREIKRLADAGADCGLIAANTPHIVFDEIRCASPIPLISIVEATCEAAQAMRLKKVGLFGTRFTMQGRFFPDVFSRAGIALVTPHPEEQTYIHDKYFAELVNGIFLPETREALTAIIEQLRSRDGIDGLILGGTELPLILREPTVSGIPLLDTTRIHVKSMIACMLS